MLKELLYNKKEYINHFFDHVNLDEAHNFLNILKECEGLIFLTGVGKSGIVAEKIAVTMTSTGTRALFLSPTNALHGDLGILTEKDVFILISKSGETEELLALIPFLKNRNVKILSIVCEPNSRLAKASTCSMYLPLKKELCPYNMAPTTSTAIQLIFGDIIAIALMRLKNFTLDQYALNHPAGSIGKRITLKVNDLMLKESQIPICQSNNKLSEVLVELSQKQCGCVLVVDEALKLQGIFTDGDLRRSLQNHGVNVLDHFMHNLMTKKPKHIAPFALAWDAMKMMEKGSNHSITCLPVLSEDDTLLGLIKLHDIIQSGI